MRREVRIPASSVFAGGGRLCRLYRDQSWSEGPADHCILNPIYVSDLMDILAPFIYQFVGGGLLLCLGLVGAIKVGALDLRSREDRRWTSLVLLIFVLYLVVQGWLQLVVGVEGG